MSDLLENPELANVKAEFYLSVAETKGEPVITQPVSVSVKGKKVLVVDDVADTCKSLALVRKHLKEQGATQVKIATIILQTLVHSHSRLVRKENQPIVIVVVCAVEEMNALRLLYLVQNSFDNQGVGSAEIGHTLNDFSQASLHQP